MFSLPIFCYSFMEVLYNMFLKKLGFYIVSLRWQPGVTKRNWGVDVIYPNRNTFYFICSCEWLMLLHRLLKYFKAFVKIFVWLPQHY